MHGNSISLHIVVCDSPTFRASKDTEFQFFSELQDVLNDVPHKDKLVVLGNFNARIGSRERTGDEWDRVHGPHGYGECNVAGKSLPLSFLSMNNATV